MMDNKVFRAVIDCAHQITDECVILRFDPREPGHNALNQLHRRLDAAVNPPISDGDARLKIACAALEFIVNDYPRQTNEGAQRRAAEALAQIGNTNSGGWVSVKDRLPPNAEHVLIATTIWADAHDAIRCEGYWMNLSMAIEQEDSDNEVTHWHVKPISPNDGRVPVEQAPARGGSGVRCYHYKPCSEGKHVEGLEFVRCAECPARPGSAGGNVNTEN